MRKKIVAGNWKMNCNREEAFSLVTEIKGMIADEILSDVTVILAPPFVHLASVTHLINGSGIHVAAQNCASEPAGAFTGEVSASMIKSVGAAYVIIGHSERRSYFNESNSILAKKTEMALSNNLVPVFCIGETLHQREANEHFSIIKEQLHEGVFHLDAEKFSKLIIAYEPVWAIGTGKTASPAQAQEMHLYIRNVVEDHYEKKIASQLPLLYGGSCNENNANELFSLADVDGGLIGGASLKSRSFVNIIKSF